MIRSHLRSLGIVLAALFVTRPAIAMVGGAPSDASATTAIVTIVGSRGNFCTGALVASDLVLSAAHCVTAGATYKIVDDGDKKRPVLRDIKRFPSPPDFNLQGMVAHRASADVALLQLA